jgi:hypothetical protein
VGPEDDREAGEEDEDDNPRDDEIEVRNSKTSQS